VRLFQERFCIGSRSSVLIQPYDISGVVAHRTVPTDSRHGNSSSFSVILGPNCSIARSNTRVNLVNQTGSDRTQPTGVCHTFSNWRR
jgi:hypothetical protein